MFAVAFAIVGVRERKKVGRGDASENVYLDYTAVDEKLTELVTMERRLSGGLNHESRLKMRQCGLLWG